MMKYVLYSGHPVAGGFFAGLRIESVNGTPIVAARAYRHLGAPDVIAFGTEEFARQAVDLPYMLLGCGNSPESDQARVFNSWYVLAVSDEQLAEARADFLDEERRAWA